MGILSDLRGRETVNFRTLPRMASGVNSFGTADEKRRDRPPDRTEGGNIDLME
jgi:hypothetical protein